MAEAEEGLEGDLQPVGEAGHEEDADASSQAAVFVTKPFNGSASFIRSPSLL
jgi:hypothetical protein